MRVSVVSLPFAAWSGVGVSSAQVSSSSSGAGTVRHAATSDSMALDVLPASSDFRAAVSNGSIDMPGFYTGGASAKRRPWLAFGE